MGDLRVLGHALARVEERQRQLAQRQLRVLVEQAHGLGGVDDRAAADRDDEVGLHLAQDLDAGADLLLGRLGLQVGEHAHARGHEMAADLVDRPPRLGVGVGDDEHLCRRDLAQALDRAGVEVRVGGHAEPLRRRLALADDLDVEQVAVVDVVGRRRPAPRPAAQRERRRERVVDPAEGADRRRRVDEDAPRADRLGEARDHGLILRVDRRGVPQAAVLGDQLARRDGVIDARRAHEAEHGHELLAHERVPCQLLEVAGQRRQQDLGVGVHREPAHRAQVRARLPERAHLHAPVGLEGQPCQRLDRVGIEDARAHALELRDDLVGDRLVDDQRLLGRADDGSVEGLGDQHVDDGHRDVGAAMQVDGGVARADADARLARLVGGLDGLRAARGPDEVDAGVVEEVLRDVERRVGDHLQGVGR